MSIVGDIVGGLAGGAAGITPTGAISAVSNLAQSIVERIWENPADREKAKLAIEQMAQTGELQKMTIESGLLQGQIAINLEEAKSESFWASGWRPGAGWVGVSALFFSTTFVFAIQTGVWLWQCIAHGALLPAPALNTTDVVLILVNLLGIGAMRSVDKVTAK